MSNHHTAAGGRSVYGSLLRASVGVLALYLAPMSVSAAPPAISALVCSGDNTSDDRTKFRTILGHLETKNTSMLRQAISASPDIVTDCNATNGYNALHYAARYGHIEGAKILIDSGVDRRKEVLVATVSSCPETPYGLALALNRLGVGVLRPPELLSVLDYDPRNTPWVIAGRNGSTTGGSDSEAGGAGGAAGASDDSATATSEACQLRNLEIRRWSVGRAY